MNVQTPHTLLWWVGAGIGYIVTMTTNPAHVSLRDGFRCLRRYEQIWVVPAVFGVAHAAFNLWVRVYEAWAVPDAPAAMSPWTGWQPPPWNEVLANSLLPAAESVSAIFNCVVTTFPLSSIVAALFLCNWRNYGGVLWHRFVGRLGPTVGTTIHALLVVCAAAALCKPLLFGGLPKLNIYFGEQLLLRAGAVLNTLSFFFECLLGVCVQIYLVLLAFAWVRGLSFDFPRLRRVAVRRFPSVFKWSAVILCVSALGISLPALLGSFQVAMLPLDTSRWLLVTRWILAGVLIVFCSAQILLIFHHEPLGETMGNALRLWSLHGGEVCWFIVVAAMHYLLLATANAFLPVALGRWTWPAATWNLLIYPLLWSALSGWLLASWVCLFRRLESSQPAGGELVNF